MGYSIQVAADDGDDLGSAYIYGFEFDGYFFQYPAGTDGAMRVIAAALTAAYPGHTARAFRTESYELDITEETPNAAN